MAKKIDTSTPGFKESLIKHPKKINRLIKDGTIKNLTPMRKYNADGWSNLYTGLGKKYDKSKYTTFSGYEVLDDITLAQLWVGAGFGKLIVSAPADDMTREWFKITGDTDGKIQSLLTDLHAEDNANLALKWRALFGGGITVMGINDGGKLEDPVNINNIKDIDWLRTFDRTDTSLTTFHFNDDQRSKNFREIEWLTVMPRYGAPFNVHIDRVLMYKGIPVPNRVETGNFWFWGMGELQSVWNELKNLCAGMEHVVKILYEFIVGKYSIDGLADLISQDKKKIVEDIISIIELAKSTINAVLMDSKDNYSRDSANVGGLAELLDRFMMALAGVTQIPVSRLFGRSAAGMNATGEGDRDNYYDMIRSRQKNILKPQMLKLVDYCNIVLGSPIQNPDIEFNPLVQQTEKEEVENKKTQADTDAIYIDRGVLTADEVAENRFGGDEYSFDTVIDLNAERGFEQEPEEEMIEEPVEEEINE